MHSGARGGLFHLCYKLAITAHELSRSPGRLGSGDVRDVLDTAFKQLGAPDKEHGKESTTDWEGRLGQLKASIAKCHRELDLKLKTRFLLEYRPDG